MNRGRSKNRGGVGQNGFHLGDPLHGDLVGQPGHLLHVLGRHLPGRGRSREFGQPAQQPGRLDEPMCHDGRHPPEALQPALRGAEPVQLGQPSPVKHIDTSHDFGLQPAGERRECQQLLPQRGIVQRHHVRGGDGVQPGADLLDHRVSTHVLTLAQLLRRATVLVHFKTKL